ncbi:MAG: M6 family metalloprotease domain-containing protein [Prevotella sp.]|nr:M6 family metalloprotease domain-containing protein [Prevotella sp.]
MRKVLLSCLSLFAATSLMAIPAKRNPLTITQSDGSKITVMMVGDEFHHSFVTSDGVTVGKAANGDFYYRNATGLTNVMAHNQKDRNEAEIKFLNAEKNNLTMAAIQTKASQERRNSARAKAPRKVGATQVPTVGSPRIPIILVQYSDKKMSNSKATFVSQYTSGSTSVCQYFTDQSNGKYKPQFDVYGIYTLNNTRATYGGNSGGNDKGVARMVGDAIDKAGNDIDWSKYDNDGDGEADVCIVVYAGVGEAQASSVSDAVWPCQWTLSAGAYYRDGSGARTRNNTKIDRFAVFNEINGSSDSGTKIDGIGTFCHEFSHCLGLPDFYETTYSYGYYGIGSWSLMDYGSYNNNGYTPIGYSAYEKNFMGWIDYIAPEENTQYTLPIFNQKNIQTDKAVKITSPLNPNEYFILENRQQQGWDKYIPDEGLMITHVTYVADRWSANTVNNKAVQLFTIIPADNTCSMNNETTDLFGQTNKAFTKTSIPASKLNMTSSGSLASKTGGAGTMDKPVTDITINSDGTVSFWYVKGTTPVATPVLTATPTSLSFGSVEKGTSVKKTFKVTGENLKGNVSATLSDNSGAFTIDKTSATATAAAGGVTFTVTFKPTAAGNYSGTVTLGSTGATSVKVSLSGSAVNPQIVTYTPEMQDAVNITETSFRAQWTDNTDKANVKSYTLWLNEIVNEIDEPDDPVEPDEPDTPITDLDPVSLQTANFSNYKAVYSWWSYSNVYRSYSKYLPSGWTCGRYLYIGTGTVISGDYIKTKTYTMPEGYDKISVVITAKPFSSYYNTPSITVAALRSGDAATATVSNYYTASTIVYVLDAASVEQLKLTCSNYPAISSIEIYAGDITATANAPMRAPSSSAREITGITNTYYTLTNLSAGNTYQFKVKALYTDGSESTWSNQKEITLARASKVVDGDATGIREVDGKKVSSIQYFDISGKVSDRPFKGMNIVVTTFEDGTQTKTKKMMK